MKYIVYITDSILCQYGHPCVRLPPYHADLNTIEINWASIKGNVVKHNLIFRQRDGKALTLLHAADMLEIFIVACRTIKNTETGTNS